MKPVKTLFSHRLFLFLLILSGLLSLALSRNAHAAAFKETRSGVWSDGTYTYYVKGSKLYQRVKGKSTVLESFGTEAAVINVASGNIYIQRNSEAGGYWLDAYRISSGKDFTVSKEFVTLAVSGSYMIALPYMPSDVSAHPINLYKAVPSGIQKVKTLAKYSLTALAYEGRFYFSSYMSSGMDGTITVYSCKPNGSGMKKVFSFGSKNLPISFLDSSVKNHRLHIYYMQNNHERNVYYDLKTGKISKK